MICKICVCPECRKVVRLVEPSAAIRYRANEIIAETGKSDAEAVQMALDEELDGYET